MVFNHRNLKTRSKIKPWKVKKKRMGEKCPRYEHPKTIHFVEYCAIEKIVGEIKFMNEVGRTYLGPFFTICF
jgi:hypothetical protein